MKKLLLALVAISILQVGALGAATTLEKANKTTTKLAEKTSSGPDLEVEQRLERAPNWFQSSAVAISSAVSGTTSANGVTLSAVSSTNYAGPLVIAVANRGPSDAVVCFSSSATAIASATGIPFQYKVAAGTVSIIPVSKTQTHAHVAGLTATAANVIVTPGNYE